MDKGFFASLFDISFTSFITTKIIKFVYVVMLVVAGLIALALVAGAFSQSAALGVVALVIIAPLFSLIYLVWGRIALELVIQIFRITELLRDQNRLQRAAFAGAGWLPEAPTAAATPAQCPNCGAAPAPGASFCRNCGHRLT